ncbi:hypothetical protein [Nostoc sp.]|uniref:hypothetical protein n=1 Tax=Nostoc sp. TaxID=1180 RepID=UPI002FF94970
MKTLFLAWQDPKSWAWFPIGRLTFDGTKYQFQLRLLCNMTAEWHEDFRPFSSREYQPLVADIPVTYASS